MKKKQFTRYALIVIIGILAAILALLCFIAWGMTGREKLPETYTWDEFLALPPEEQLVFPDRFESMEAFNNWLAKVQGSTAAKTTEDAIVGTEAVVTVPVPTFGFDDKNPEHYTWEDYQNLTPDEQMLFPDAFDSMEAFYAWLDCVQPEETIEATSPTTTAPASTAPVSTEPTSTNKDLNSKKPEDYTWEEYLALSIEEQMLFPDRFESYELFEAWWAQNYSEAG